MLLYWRGTATKRLIRINWIDIGRVQTIHRSGHQSGRGERSGSLSAAKLHDFPARVFLDRSQTLKNNKKTSKIRPDIQNTGQDLHILPGGYILDQPLPHHGSVLSIAVTHRVNNDHLGRFQNNSRSGFEKS